MWMETDRHFSSLKNAKGEDWTVSHIQVATKIVCSVFLNKRENLASRIREITLRNVQF